MARLEIAEMPAKPAENGATNGKFCEGRRKCLFLVARGDVLVKLTLS